ncbi:hypothetical protein SAMN04487943_101329 [Gracilibacillus orientalis]|uniref:Uncharacterized protein n=1 Tax=Gracilibacillus orientalis TaxID=334253 RepID=A0A1I4HCT2_9BACI|nr:hypothetical protein [Gracilibacillus orientalis]SFL39417.1 hypothetical protein SAMN04487943_101329 [Gracilibacillus orientalis]
MNKEYYKWLQIAKDNGIHSNLYWRRVKEQGWSYKKAATQNVRKCQNKIERDVAIYKGDTFIVFGSKSFVAKYLGKSTQEITQLCTPSIREIAEKSSRMYGIYLEN